MRKLQLISLILLFACPSFAATVYTVREVELMYDSSRGTFTKGGSSRGAIVGFTFSLDGTDETDGTYCTESRAGKYLTPLLRIPNKAELLADIEATAKHLGLQEKLDKCLSETQKKNEITKITKEDKVPDLEGSVITFADKKSK